MSGVNFPNFGTQIPTPINMASDNPAENFSQNLLNAFILMQGMKKGKKTEEKKETPEEFAKNLTKELVAEDKRIKKELGNLKGLFPEQIYEEVPGFTLFGRKKVPISTDARKRREEEARKKFEDSPQGRLQKFQEKTKRQKKAAEPLTKEQIKILEKVQKEFLKGGKNSLENLFVRLREHREKQFLENKGEVEEEFNIFDLLE